MSLSANEVFSWAASAKPGSLLVYHVGHHLHRGWTDPTYTDAVHAARALFNEGRVDLVQKRLSSGNTSRFEYRAVLRRETHVPARDSRFDVPDQIFEARLAA